MREKEQLEAIKDIRNMMNRSVRFLSLSGLSGVFAGIYALIASYIVFQFLGAKYPYRNYTFQDTLTLIYIGIGTLILSIITAYFFTHKKAKKQGVTLWSDTTKVALINLMIPLVTGGILCIAFINNGLVGLIAPTTLIFYGLALVNVSRHTFPTIRQLGIIETTLGLISAFYIGYGLLFWALGFGLLHIIYGVFMYYKYDRI